ncbi:MAG: nucleotidyltransferase family protein [Burkholderiaceae bacterium]|uniref:nucleotidyltransferase family protein n=1 Tax=Hydrogenophaga sp. TaxID=1904254 RepID=UPI00274FCA93|nr:nucleotidyltransferase family protein [Hydrogenophaga sp.]MDP2066041.1 nucleotidyltransferase family protein [Burkholderiaceae bacterium]MDZ4399915.1 nucleotidyltransferase family protein [Hydrogenophaga sp.]
MPLPPSPALTPPANALILAAGRGERMRPLTDTCPKPLLMVQGKPLLQWHLDALACGGFHDVVVNTAWLEPQFLSYFGLEPPSNGHSLLLIRDSAAPMRVRLSREGHDFGRALETAGGIARALPLLDEVFWVLAGDVFTPGFVFSQDHMARFAASGRLAHLWLVPNPPHNPAGDFGLSPTGLALNQAPQRFTYSTIGLYRRALFEAPHCTLPPGNPDGISAPLAPLLRAAMDNGKVSAELYTGAWIDVGTPARLAALNAPHP